MEQLRMRALCAGFCASLALLGPVRGALPAASTVVSGYRCTIVGTAAGDALAGTPGRDVICGLGGNDVISGKDGNDVVLGGAGADFIETGGGSDVVLAGSGNDTIRAWDGSPDRIDGGPGIDHAWRDGTVDTVKNVERIG
jgi:Ca2+-binding RTX toxin-like protein